MHQFRAAVHATAERRAVLAIGVLALAHLPIFAALCANLWGRPHYQFFPLVPLGAAFLLVLRLKQDGICTLSGSGGSLMPLAAGGLLATAIVADSPWLGVLACLATSAAVLVGVGGWSLFRLVYPAWCFLFLMIPPPFGLDAKLIFALQGLTAKCASVVLDLVGVFHHLTGNVVEVAGRRYLVEEACSGIQSLLATLTCTLFYIIWQRRSWLHSGLLLGAAVGWVLLENVARVAGVVAVTSRGGIDLSVGWKHEGYGLALFCATLGLTWSTDRLLLYLLTRSTVAPLPGAGKGQAFRGLPVVDWQRSWLLSPGFVAAFVVLGFGQLFLLSPLVWSTPTDPAAALAPALAAITQDSLPPDIGAWRRGEFRIVQRGRADRMAETSLTWRYARPDAGLSAIVSLDCPYPGFHDLALCYRANGWVVDEETDSAPADDPTIPFVQLRLRKRQGAQALVLFSAFDRNGHAIRRPPTRTGVDVVLRVQSRLAALASLRLPERAPAPTIGPPVLQMQLFLESARPPDEARIAEVRQLFRDCLLPLRARCAEANAWNSATGTK